MNILYLVLYFVGFAIAFYIGYQLASRKWKAKYERLESNRDKLRRGLKSICITLGLDMDGDTFTAFSKVIVKSYEFYINYARDEITLIVGDKQQNE